MRVRIDYEAVYTYETPVSFSPLTLRILPRAHSAARWLDWSLKTEPEGDRQRRIDRFGNETAFVFFDMTEHLSLRTVARFDLALSPVNPFHFLIDSHALKFPFDYDATERRALAPYLEVNDSSPSARILPRLPFNPMPSGCPTLQGVINLISELHQLIAYEIREQGPPRPPEETLALRTGACRDTALLLDKILKELGFASRLASGYLCEFQTDPGNRIASGAMHAWCEVYLPGAGWIGVDATNGVLCDHHYLTCAVGIDPDDVAPISGSYFAKRTIPSRLETKVLLTQSAT